MSTLDFTIIRDDIIRAKEQMEANTTIDFTNIRQVSGFAIPITPFDAEKATPSPDTPAGGFNGKKKKKEKNMCYECDGPNTGQTTEDRRINYLELRLSDADSEKHMALRKQFGLEDDDAPATFNDFLDRLTKGKFVYPEDKRNNRMWPYHIVDKIRWRDPELKEDRIGFEAAKEKKDKLVTETTDIIRIKTPEEGLKALQEFESATLN